MKTLAAVLSVVCTVQLLIASERIPMRGLDLGFETPENFRPGLGGIEIWTRGAAKRISAWARRTREAASSPPVLIAAPADIDLRGAFASSDGAARVAFDGAVIRLSEAEWRTAPVRIAAGTDVYAAEQTFARRFAAAPDAQIELRRIVPNDAADEAEVAPSPACQGDRPGFIALLHRPGRVDLMLFREGAAPGPGASATGVCESWSFIR